MRIIDCSFVLALMSASVSPLSAAVVYDEAISGDLSNNRLAPTAISIGLGSNQVIGATGSTASTDRDYFKITVPDNAQLVSITLLPVTTIGGDFSFFGVEAGSSITIPPTAPNAAGLLGWWHYSDGDVNTDILGKMGIPALGSSGFTPPLASGDYAFWIQDFNPGPIAYGLDFNIANIAVVPLPAAGFAFLSGLGMLGLARRKPAGAERGGH